MGRMVKIFFSSDSEAFDVFPTKVTPGQALP